MSEVHVESCATTSFSVLIFACLNLPPIRRLGLAIVRISDHDGRRHWRLWRWSRMARTWQQWVESSR